MPTEHETEPIVVDTFVVFDLDRTGLNNDGYTHVLCLQMIDHGLTAEQANAEYEHIVGQYGKSFAAIDYFESKFGADTTARVVEEIEEMAKTGELDDDLLALGIKESLDHLSAQGVPFAVLTYSTSVPNQRHKLGMFADMVGRPDLQYEITTVPQKGVSIESTWYDKEGDTFTVPFSYGDRLVVARNIVIVDDKLHNLESSNKHVTGIWIDNGDVPAEGTIAIRDVALRLMGGERINDIARRYEPTAE
jgi:hypothetical protein